MPANRLIAEKSPYLLQHAHNPVDWYPWSEEAFEKARREDKPIFLSIGYSTCHWCHVMERESFENEELAALLNRHFVPIKVDREERPDVDRVYMTFVQASTGGGGWPMSVWLTPDLKPFFGGTYFPPDNRYGRPGFGAVLEQLAQAWLTDRTRILAAGEEVLRQLRGQLESRPASSPWRDEAAIESCFFSFRRGHDARLGGFGGAPKFPRPSTHNFLLRYWKRTGNDEALEMALLTLREMAKGGMYDQIGGGFHRYSVDDRWFVPHFEKMLYDQAQLAASYLEAYQITSDPQYAAVARGIFQYVLRDLRSPEGAFYSAEDADSVIDPARPKEKGEGAFYIWTQQEIERLLPPDEARWFCYRYGVEPDGNVRNDPHGEFTGKNILYQAHTLAEVGRKFDTDAAGLAGKLDDAAMTLLAARGRRVRPHLDDKILTSWNGLMISAFALGAQVLGEPRYAEAARTAADFILSRLYDSSTGVLLRRYRDGEAAIAGFLDDYALFGTALLDLYETTFSAGYLETALAAGERMKALFEDADNGGFYSSASDDHQLVLRLKDDYDGAEPSGNSAAAGLLLRLSHLTGRADFRASVEKTLAAIGGRFRGSPSAIPQMLVVQMAAAGAPKQIVIAGRRHDSMTQEMLRTVYRRFLPGRLILLLDGKETRERMSRWAPAVAHMTETDGRPAAYVCENFTCHRPVTDIGGLRELLE